MKLAVSNIAWNNEALEEHLALLRAIGCDGVELAPSCIWPEPTDVSMGEAARVRDLARGLGLEIVGFHSLLYTRQDLQLFGSRETRDRTTEYLKTLARLCGVMGGRTLVLGSGRNRNRGGRDQEMCTAWACEILSEVAVECERTGTLLVIESLPPSDTDFINSIEEGASLVQRVGRRGFGLHIDIKAMLERGEDWKNVLALHGKTAKHVHVGDPGLAPPGHTGVDHGPIGRALRDSGYTGYVSIEMRRGFGNTQEVVARSVEYVRRCYLGTGD